MNRGENDDSDGHELAITKLLSSPAGRQTIIALLSDDAEPQWTPEQMSHADEVYDKLVDEL
jgi:hypothetical protein